MLFLKNIFDIMTLTRTFLISLERNTFAKLLVTLLSIFLYIPNSKFTLYAHVLNEGSESRARACRRLKVNFAESLKTFSHSVLNTQLPLLPIFPIFLPPPMHRMHASYFPLPARLSSRARVHSPFFNIYGKRVC